MFRKGSERKRKVSVIWKIFEDPKEEKPTDLKGEFKSIDLEGEFCSYS